MLNGGKPSRAFLVLVALPLATAAPGQDDPHAACGSVG